MYDVMREPSCVHGTAEMQNLTRISTRARGISKWTLRNSWRI